MFHIKKKDNFDFSLPKGKNLRKMPQMIYNNTVKITVVILITFLLSACPSRQNAAPEKGVTVQSWSLNKIIPPSWHESAWNIITQNYKLNRHKFDRPVQKQLRFFKKNPEYLVELTRNAKPYLYYVYQETQKRGMPAEVALLPMIESNYNPFVYVKSSGASGVWQLTPSTASGYGLKINRWYDGRRDIIESTKAALDYLAYLHKYFGDWLLAFAAYDAGEGTVIAAIKHNQHLHKPTDFWSLSLPAETKQYVPRLLALAQVIKTPEPYHLKLKPVANAPYFQRVDIDKELAFGYLAKVSQLDLKAIHKLNAGFRHEITQPSGKYHLLMPINKTKVLETHLANTNPSREIYKVRGGDNLSIIAHQFGTTIGKIKIANHLANNILQPGQKLLIPENLKKQA